MGSHVLRLDLCTLLAIVYAIMFTIVYLYFPSLCSQFAFSTICTDCLECVSPITLGL